MLALLYILLIAVFGCCLVKVLIPDVRRLYVASAVNKKILANIPDWLFIIPAGLIVGILITNFANYLILYGVSKAIPDHIACKNASILLTVAIVLYGTFLCVAKIYRRSKAVSPESKIPAWNNHNSNIFFYGLSLVFFTIVASFLYFYTYRVSNGELIMGYSVYSDLSPHTSMVSSFGVGFNMPTHYMHFSDDGIRYHFLFYYFAGILQYLGLSIDFALNIPSIIGMVCCFTLLGLLGVLLSGRRLPFILAPILVLFRSSLNVFSQIIKLQRHGGYSIKDCIKLLSQSSAWSDITPYDSWGIWAINVYPNQRHLMFGIALILLLILLFLPYVRRMSVATLKCPDLGNKIMYFFFSRNAWIWRLKDSINPWGTVILSMLIAASMPYYHGSCLIAVLLVLFGMAIFSESRLIYLCCALTSVISSFIQTRCFSGSASNVVNFKFTPGFILGEGTPFPTLMSYLIMVTGLTLVISIITLVVLLVSDILRGKPAYRFILGLCFALPFIFGFTFQVTTEMLANHKFIQISLILLDVFVALFMSNLFIIPFKIKAKDVSIDVPSSPRTAYKMADISSEAVCNDAAMGDDEVMESTNDLNQISNSAELQIAQDNNGESKMALEIEAQTTGAQTIEAIEDTKDAESSAMLEEASKSSNSEENNLTSEAKVTTENQISPVNEASISDNLVPPTLDSSRTSPKEPSKAKGLPLPAFISLQVASIILALVLLVPLLATGISEWFVYYNLNKWYLTVNTRSEMVEWIIKNTSDSDVFLTPEWSINRFNLTGRAMYYGWPYYAWSAGHDTYKRDEIYHWLLTGSNSDIDEFIRYCKERNIRYIIADPEFDQSGETEGYFNWSLFAENLTQVAYFVDDNNTIIYKIY
ncbi:MAG: hypothetical protein MJ172_03425 [Clostridia bacterium]|nr:hypothetical protein [Clostridia bacterium]